MTTLADAFWVSCAKEMLAPSGALLALRSYDAQRRAYSYTLDEGTWFEAHEPRVRLLAGLREIAADPQPLVRRRVQVELVAQTLRGEGVRILEPAGAHAVFVPVDAELLAGSPARARALESLLYERAGVRVLISPYPRMGYAAIMRLAITVGQYSDEALVRAAKSIAKLFRDPSGAHDLVEAPGVESIHETVKSYARK
jgi:tryptophanase